MSIRCRPGNITSSHAASAGKTSGGAGGEVRGAAAGCCDRAEEVRARAAGVAAARAAARVVTPGVAGVNMLPSWSTSPSSMSSVERGP